jgi:glucan endo-1,3-alpha-glucosidase
MRCAPQRQRRSLRGCIACGALLLSGWSAPAQVNTPPQRRMVFAHYMLANQDAVVTDAANDSSGERAVAADEEEIAQARALGIDGFALNAGGWSREPRYIRRAAEMFEAARRVGGFRLMFSADMCCSNDAADVEDMLRRFANNPRYAPVCFQHNGRFVLTTFSGSGRGVAFWQGVVDDLERGTGASRLSPQIALPFGSGVASSVPLRVELVPAFFFGGELPNAQAIATGLASYADTLGGAFYWGIAGVPGALEDNQLRSSEAYAAVLHSAGRLYMAPICFQFWGADAGRAFDYSGYEGLRRMWMDAINRTRPEWVEIITWNDFIEGTYVSPIDDPARYPHANDLGASRAPADTPHFFHSHAGAYQLLRFFIAWYKTGQQPAILNDQVFWAYRSQLVTTAAARTRLAGIRLHGPMQDKLYITANLSAAAELEVRMGGRMERIRLAAGSHDVSLPLQPGPPPHFELRRSHQILAASDGDDAVTDTARLPDLYESTGWMHD